MKVIMIYDQIQSGAGIKDAHNIPLGAIKGVVGPAIMMEPFLKEVNGKVIACLYCGDGYFLNNRKIVTEKMVAMVKKIKPDVVICGPCFNYLGYGEMAGELSYAINSSTTIPALSAMSLENKETIDKYKEKTIIVKTPKKGGPGLNDALEGMCRIASALYRQESFEELKQIYCY